MPVEEQQPQDQPAGEMPPPLEIGKRLSAAREQRNLTLENVASMLHVDVAVLKNLESDNFEALGAAVYVRGHLRKYAAILGLPAEELLAAYQAQAVEVDVTPIVSEGMAMSRRRRGRGLWLLLAVLALALVIGMAAWWWLVLRDDSRPAGAVDQHSSSQRVPVLPEPVSALPTPQATVQESSPGNDVDAPDLPAPTAQEQQSIAQQSVAASPSPEPAQDKAVASPGATQNDSPVPVTRQPAGDVAALVFEFAEDSWVEVYDGTGQRVLYGLFNTGTRRQLSAQGPFSVYLGYARGVSIMLDGEPYEVPASVFRGNTARFNIDVGN